MRFQEKKKTNKNEANFFLTKEKKMFDGWITEVSKKKAERKTGIMGNLLYTQAAL